MSARWCVDVGAKCLSGVAKARARVHDESMIQIPLSPAYPRRGQECAYLQKTEHA